MISINPINGNSAVSLDVPSLLSMQQAVKYWYSGKELMELHSQPGFYVLRPHYMDRSDINPVHVRQLLERLVDQGEHDGWHIYKTLDNTGLLLPVDSCLSPLYSRGDNWQTSVIYAQDAGVIVGFKQPKTATEVNDWLVQQGQEKRQVKQLSSDRFYLLEDIDGIQAVLLANELFERDRVGNLNQINSAYPNWI